MKTRYEEFIKPKLDLVKDWARHGVYNEQIAVNLGVSPGTFQQAIFDHPELAAALKTREEADAIVENALFRRACGYDYQETTKDGSVVDRHLPADVTACLAWLNHRRPQDWVAPAKGVQFEGKVTLEGVLRAVEGDKY